MRKIYYHLPGLFEFYELYKIFLKLFREHREYFYDWCEIGSIYGAPGDCLWGGGRVGYGDASPRDVAALIKEYNVSARLTFSNSLIRIEHLYDKECNYLCELFSQGGKDVSNSEQTGTCQNGIIIHSDILLDYIRTKYPEYYFVSSTTKVITDFKKFEKELNRKEFRYIVPDFRLNKDFKDLDTLLPEQREKIEFLCNECCWFGCYDRKNCYENVSRKSLGEECPDHICVSPDADKGYRFSLAMKNQAFIGLEDIRNIYCPKGFRHFKIEGRSLGSAVVLEMLLYYMTKPEYQINVREAIYLDSMLDLF